MIEPMKAVLADKPFSDPDWIFERKLDGDPLPRASATASARPAVSRTDRRMNDDYPEIVRGARARSRAGDFVVDGEVVAFDGAASRASRACSAAAASACRSSSTCSTCLRLDGEDLRDAAAARAQGARCAARSSFGGPVRFNPHRNGEHGEELFREACRKGLRGRDRQARRQPLPRGAARATGSSSSATPSRSS